VTQFEIKGTTHNWERGRPRPQRKPRLNVRLELSKVRFNNCVQFRNGDPFTRRLSDLFPNAVAVPPILIFSLPLLPEICRDLRTNTFASETLLVQYGNRLNQRTRKLLAFFLVSAAVVAGWALVHFNAVGRFYQSASQPLTVTSKTEAELWTQGVEKVKADRGEAAGGNAAFEIPPELRHYSDRHWFLATQVAEVKKNNVQTCQDFVDLAAMIKRGEMVSLPAATENYILFGVGAKADNEVFSRFEDDHSIALYNEAQLNDEYQRLDAAHSNLQTQVAALKNQLGALKTRDRARRRELQKEVSTRQQQLNATEEEKAQLDHSYGQADSRQKLFREYESLQTLAKNFEGRAYDIGDSSDRQALKLNLLRSLRPEALRVMEEIAIAYQQQFDRPLPVSSLVRPEQYQHALRKTNRNAVLIDTPPHSTGLAFDIDYRYMSAVEQMFLMTKLASMKNAGRIEVIRERSANYHVFVFLDGVRPSDDLITASLDQATVPPKESNHVATQPAKDTRKSQKAKKTKAKTKPRRR
jgi:hypothetical protein